MPCPTSCRPFYSIHDAWACRSESGQIDQDMLKRNLDAAIDVYLERVDGAPCADTEIHLFKGADSASERAESELLKIFFEG